MILKISYASFRLYFIVYFVSKVHINVNYSKTKLKLWKFTLKSTVQVFLNQTFNALGFSCQFSRSKHTSKSSTTFLRPPWAQLPVRLEASNLHLDSSTVLGYPTVHGDRQAAHVCAYVLVCVCMARYEKKTSIERRANNSSYNHREKVTVPWRVSPFFPPFFQHHSTHPFCLL